MENRIKTIKDFSLWSLLLSISFIAYAQAQPITIVAQPMEVSASVATPVKDEQSFLKKEAQSDQNTITVVENNKEENKSEKNNSTQIIVPPKVDEPNSATETLNTKLVLSQLEQLRKLKEEYQKEIEKGKKWPKWTCIKHSFKVGEEDPAIVVVKKQLAEGGYLVLGETSEEKEQELTPKFDEKLFNALKIFQKYNMLDDDGIIGFRTCKALNLSPEERLRKIELNIKRWEELEPSLKGKYVLVNIPTYNLYAMEDSKVVLSQPVIVGLKSRRTPLFATPMVSVVLNPSWGVPVKIFVEDKLRKVMHDPEYLDQHHYMVMDRDGQIIPSNTVDWSHVSKHYFPYRIRQLPGKYNALGNIKFNLDNKDAIYMHGTPQTNLFNRASRALSSGCVRLAAPRELAVWALEGTRYNSINKIDEKIKGEQTITVPLSKHIPVHFIYITVWVDGEGKAVFSDDPYQLDK